MSGHTRKHLISKKPYTYENFNKKKNISWREVFRKGIAVCTEAGLMLKGARAKSHLTQRELAEKIGVKTHHISEMEHGKRSIGKSMAHRFARIFKVDYRLFL